MNANIVLGGFAFYVVIVSLSRLIAQEEPPRLRAMKRVWGRTQGLVLHFIVNVLVPILFGVFYLARGAASVG